MTDNEMETILKQIAEYMESNAVGSSKAKKKKSRKGLYSKVIVSLCILLAVGYTGFCLLMQWVHGFQPETRRTFSFFAFGATELWSLEKINSSKKDSKKG